MYKKLLLTFSFCILLALSQKAISQKLEPIFEDAEGKTSIITPRGFFGINTANSSIRLQYFYTKSASPNPKDPTLRGRENRFYFGINVAGTATGGVTNLFSEGNFTPGTSADLFLGHRSLFFSPLDRSRNDTDIIKTYRLAGKGVTINDWLTLRTGVQAARYRLYDASRPFNEQVSTESFRGYLAQLAYTVLFNGRTSVGLSYDISKINNIGSLAPVKFKQQTVRTDPTGQTTRTFEQEVSAYAGRFVTSTVGTLSVDVVENLFTKSGTIYAINLYGRCTEPQNDAIYRAGLGFYVFPPGKSKPNRLFGGVFIESGDLTNKVSGEPDFLKRIEIGFTIKFILPALGG